MLNTWNVHWIIFEELDVKCNNNIKIHFQLFMPSLRMLIL